MSSKAVELAPGDVVRLKSGGPLMTIAERQEDGLWLCVYFKEESLVFVSVADGLLSLATPEQLATVQ